jgi:hypothetical protein
VATGHAAKVELAEFNLSPEHLMTHDRIQFSTPCRRRTPDPAGAGRTVLKILMVGAGRFERSSERATCRNGYRERALGTRLGAQPQDPEAVHGTLLPALLEARRTAERALVAGIFWAARPDGSMTSSGPWSVSLVGQEHRAWRVVGN